MASALKLRVIEGGLGQFASQVPIPAPTVAADRLVDEVRVVRWPPVLLFIASLAIHAALIAVAMDLRISGEPPAEGGTNQTIIIEGVSADAFDDAPPMIAAREIQVAQSARLVEEDIAPAPVSDALIAGAVEPALARLVPPDERLPTREDHDSEVPVAETEPTTDTLVANGLPIEAVATPLTVPAAEPDRTIVVAPPDSVAANRADEAVDPGHDVGQTAAVIPDQSAMVTPEAHASAAAETPVAAPVGSSDSTSPNAAPAGIVGGDKIAATADDEPIVPGNVAEAAKVDAREPALVGERTLTPLRDERAEPVEPDTVVAAAEVPPEPAATKTSPAAKPQASAPKASTPSAAGKAARGPTVGKAGAGGAKGGAGKASLSSYNARLSAHLRAYRTYPPEAAARRITGSASVSFTIDRSGRVLSARLSRGTGHRILDDTAIAMVRRASPFPPIPAELGKATFAATVPIRFAPR